MALAKTPEFLRSFEFKNVLKDNWKPADKLIFNDPSTKKKDENLQYSWELPSDYLESRGYLNFNSDFLGKREENSTVAKPIQLKEKKTFLEKIKDAWIRFVHKNKNSTISVNNTESSLSPSQSFLNFLYDDDSWLKENTEITVNSIKTSTEIPHINETSKNDLKIFENITESDFDFLKKIINCFKKNKEQITEETRRPGSGTLVNNKDIVNEHINEQNRKTGSGTVNKSDENVSFPHTTTVKPSIISATITSTTTSEPTTKPPIFENCSQSKFNFTLNNTIEGISIIFFYIF